MYLILFFIITRFFRGEQSRISVHCAEQGSPPGRRQRLGMGARLACGVRCAEACRAQSREEPPGRRGQGGTEGGRCGPESMPGWRGSPRGAQTGSPGRSRARGRPRGAVGGLSESGSRACLRWRAGQPGRVRPGAWRRSALPVDSEASRLLTVVMWWL